MTSLRSLLITLAAGASLAMATPAPAQDISLRKFQLAQSYQESGDLANAARLYKELYDGSPGDTKYWVGVRTTYMELRRYEELIGMVVARVEKSKNTDDYILLGDLYWKTGKTLQADEAWSSALSTAGNDPRQWGAVAHSQSENRLFDKAAATLEKGRKSFGSPTTFADELAQLYGLLGEFRKGLTEVITSLDASGNLNKAQGRITAFLATDKGVQETSKAMSDIARERSSDLVIQRLHSWFLRETRNYVEALAVARRLDDMQKSQGRDLLAFADLARREGALPVALQAYSAVIEGGNKQLLNNALLGYARTMEQQMMSGDSLSTDLVAEVARRYEQIISDYGKSAASAEALFRLAAIEYSRRNNAAKAEKYLLQLIEESPGSNIAARGTVELSTIYIATNRIDEARSLLQDIPRRFPRETDIINEAQNEIAELAFCEGKLEAATEIWQKLSIETNRDIANDALSRLALLTDIREADDTVAIQSYGRGILYARQRQYGEAIRSLGDAYAAAPTRPIGERSLFEAAETAEAARMNDTARTLYGKLLAERPTTLFGDRAVFAIAKMDEKAGKTKEAISGYVRILTDFPKSPLGAEARKRIRALGGD